MLKYVKEKKYLAFNFLLDEMILAFVIKDDVDFLGAVATNIGTW